MSWILLIAGTINLIIGVLLYLDGQVEEAIYLTILGFGAIAVAMVRPDRR